MQKLLFFLMLGLLAVNFDAAAQVPQAGKTRQVRKVSTTTRPDDSGETTTRPSTTGAEPRARKALPRTTKREQPTQTRRTEPSRDLPPVIQWPEQPNRRDEDPDNRWSTRDKDRRDDRRDDDWERRDRRDDDWERRDRREDDDDWDRRDRRDRRDWDDDHDHCSCHGNGNGNGHGKGKGKGHYKKKGKGHSKHGCN
jgi:hypothetical protein